MNGRTARLLRKFAVQAYNDLEPGKRRSNPLTAMRRNLKRWWNFQPRCIRAALRRRFVASIAQYNERKQTA
jgi:hypothetical protein